MDSENFSTFLENLILESGGKISPGENLRVTIKRQMEFNPNFSLAKLSKQTNIPIQLIQDYIADKKKIKKDHIKKLSQQLGIAESSLTCKIKRPK